MFVDEAKITVQAGDGGDGAVSFHTEKYIPHGGPDGGDGGRGGHVIFIPKTGINTLAAFRYRRKYVAENGQNGGGKKQYGRAGRDLEIEVPVGTIVKDLETGQVMADLTVSDQPVIIASGGKGGRGNVHFATSVRQTPRFAQFGESGDLLELSVELKLIADVGLIGFPNVGKSTLLAHISRARPKIADYPFTTLKPNLGVVERDDYAFVVADIPGLIEGAHTGRGLGLAFLRHTERTRLLIHMLDASGMSGRDPLLDLAQINQELASYDQALAEKPQIVVLNKADAADPEQLAELRQEIMKQTDMVAVISAVTGQGVIGLLNEVAKELKRLPTVDSFATAAEHVSYVFRKEPPFRVERDAQTFRVTGDWIDKVVRNTNFDQHESLQYFQRLIKRKGVISQLEKAGISAGDLVVLAGFEFEYQP